MKYATIKTVDIANGTGVRVSLFVSGCTHRCPDCFNEIAWDFQYGEDFTQDTIDFILQALAPQHIAGLTLLGGEPMELINQVGLLPLLRQVHERFPNKDIWCYTGYLYEDLQPGGRVYGAVTDEILSYLDILVDGPFLVDQKNIRLKFRGSENQRIIDIKKTNQARKIILWDEK